MTLRYGSVCSGIEAATAAWHHMGWEAAFFSEIEKFPCAVLQHHYPDVPLHGDFTTIKENEYGKIDLLVGGTPCQSFSVAGLRGGLDDDRGNLALEFCRLAQREQPRWIVWENVPGVLSSNGGRDFGSILGALEDLGYGLAYRVLDAQYFGVAQRRRRVFVVGYLGDWRPAAAVLFERHSMSGHPAPSRQARQEAAGTATAGAGGSGGDGGLRPDLAGPLTAGMHKGPRGTEAVESGHVVTVGTLRAHHPGTAGTQSDTDHIVATYPINTQLGLRGPDTSNTSRDGFGVGDETDPAYTLQAEHNHAVAYSIMPMNSGKDYKARETDISQPLMAGGPVGGNQGGDFIVTPFDTTQITSPHNYSNPQEGDPCHPLAAGAHPPAVAYAIQERAVCENPDAGPDGIGVRADNAAYTLEARSTPQAVAYALQDVRGLDKKQNGKGWSDEGVSYTVDTHATQGVAHVEPAIAWSEELTASVDLAGTIQRGGSGGRHDGVMVPSQIYQDSEFGVQAYDQAGTLRAGRIPAHQMTVQQSTVRRLTPVECERLQGFPDNFTAIPWRKKGAEDCPDGPRYKALGNSMAVPVMRWIGERIRLVDDYISII